MEDFDISNIKLLASDLDGTLLSSRFEIEDFDIFMLKELQKLGVYIVLASGLCLFR